MTERGAFTVLEAAEWLGRSAQTVRRLIAEGQLPAVEVRATTMISRSALERLVDPQKLDLRAMRADDIEFIVKALHDTAADHDAQYRLRASTIADQLATRLAYARALTAPIQELAS